MSRAALAAGAAGACGAWAAVEMAAAVGVRAARARARDAGVAGARPRAIAGALIAAGRRLGAPAPPGDLETRLAAAGLDTRLDAADAMTMKLGGALAALVLALALAPGLPGRLAWLALPAAPLAAFLAPDLWIARRSRARGRAIERDLPDLLDLLAVALVAGLPLTRALAEVGRHGSGVLAREWRRAAAEAACGVASDVALAALGARCPAASMRATVAALGRAQRHGAPLGDTLAALAHQARAERARRVREDAQRAAPKIQLVVALGLVPSVLLLVAAALVAGLGG